jgi:hypothetical protein
MRSPRALLMQRLGHDIDPGDIWERLERDARAFLTRYAPGQTWTLERDVELDTHSRCEMTLTLRRVGERALVFRYSATPHRLAFIGPPPRRTSKRAKTHTR